MGQFPPPADPDLTASVLVTLRASTAEEAIFTGTKGSLRIHRPAHCPTKLTLTAEKSRTESVEETFDFPLPTASQSAILPWNYPGSEGMVYQVRSVVKAINEGRTESEDWTHNECINTMHILDQMREQVRYPHEPCVRKNLSMESATTAISPSAVSVSGSEEI